IASQGTPLISTISSLPLNSLTSVTVHPAVGPSSKMPRASTVHITTWRRPQHLSQILAALAVSLGPFAAGLGKGYSSPAVDSLKEQQHRFPAAIANTSSGVFTVSEQQASWVASLSLLGAFFGGMLGGLAMRFGRKRILLMTSLPFSASWLMTVFASSVEMMFATAFVGGFCCAIVLVVTQVYISEIAVPDIRGCLSAVLKIVGHIGMLISFAVGAYLDWRQLAMVVAIAPIMLFATVLYIPETPSYLVLADGMHESTWRSCRSSSMFMSMALAGFATYQVLGLHGAYWLYAAISVGGLCFVMWTSRIFM
ncbi:hypothetical protein L9F63_004250, partial [Diploptera punctata]